MTRRPARRSSSSSSNSASSNESSQGIPSTSITEGESSAVRYHLQQAMNADCVRRRDLAVVEVMKIRLSREHEGLLPYIEQIKRRLDECSNISYMTVICVLGENILDATLADIQKIIRSYLSVLQSIGQLESPLAHD
jgi:hypothetical protein